MGRWFFRALLLFAASSVAWGGNAAMAQVLPITIVELRAFDFGYCDIVNGATYTVAAAESAGVTGCLGSTSGKFQVTGDASAKITISLPNRVTITNGSDTISVNVSKSPTGGNIRLDGTGNLTIYVGGNFKVPQGGLATSGLFVVSDILTVLYK